MTTAISHPHLFAPERAEGNFMMNVQEPLVDADELVGNTPMVRLRRLFPQPHVRVFAKLEFYNPTGSIKDRVVRHIIDDAERTGRLRPGGTIVESTSGNTGAAIALIAAQRGYRAVLTMPDKVSREKQNALKAMGARIIVCPTAAPPGSAEHYLTVARGIAADTDGAFMVDQYNNRKNVEAHFIGTGPEIWRQVGPSIDVFVASGSTGGTVSGCGRFLKSQRPDIRVVMPDPKGSIYHRYFNERKVDPTDIGSYQVEGVGEDHLVGCMDFDVLDEVIQFTDTDAFKAARALARVEGIMGGGSGGANIWACQQIVARTEIPITIVTVIPDSGLKYMSKFFSDAWLQEHGYVDAL